MATTTMSDVARAAGVSVMTVSNVINGRPRVSAETRLRVLAVIDDLGYEVNLAAKRLRAGRTGTVALVVSSLSHPYYGELAAQFAAAVAASGRHLVVEQSGASREGELNALSHARLQQYDGVILSVVGLDYDDVDRLRPDVPVVLLGEQEMPARFDHVSMSNVEGARLATGRLLDAGATAVAVLGGIRGGSNATDGSMSDLRTRGWRLAHADRGLIPQESLILELDDLESATACAVVSSAVGQERFDALFAITDQVALGALAALTDAELRVPQDVAVIGFDNLGLGAIVRPALTSVDPSNEWIVEQAVRLIELRMAGADHPPEHLLSPVSLVERSSTRAPSRA